jgi:hypothetical protein
MRVALRGMALLTAVLALGRACGSGRRRYGTFQWQPTLIDRGIPVDIERATK